MPGIVPGVAAADAPSEAPVVVGRQQRAARVALVVAFVAVGIYVLRNFLPALIWATILAIALGPLYARVERRFPPRGHNVLVPLLFTTVVALVAVVPLVLITVQAAREARDVLDFARQAERSGIPVPDFVAHLPFGAEAAANWWRENLGQPGAPTQAFHRIGRSSLIGVTRQFGVQLVHRLVILGFTLVTLFFLFRDRERVTAQMRAAGQRLFGARGERIARQMIASVHGTVDGLVLVGLGVGFLMGVSYFLTGVPHPVLLGTLTAVAAMVPFGAPIVFCVAGLLLVAQGAAVKAGIVVALGFVVMFVADHAVRPALIGGATRLPFLWVLLGILGGVESFGLLGLFLGPAVMAVLVLLWREASEGDARPVA